MLLPAPGGGKFTAFASLVFTDGPFSAPVLTAKLALDKAADITAANNLGLWAIDREGELQLVVRAGQTLKIQGENKTLKSFIALTPPPHLTGVAYGYDRAGHVAIRATFTDRTTALVQLPLP